MYTNGLTETKITHTHTHTYINGSNCLVLDQISCFTKCFMIQCILFSLFRQELCMTMLQQIWNKQFTGFISNHYCTDVSYLSSVTYLVQWLFTFYSYCLFYTLWVILLVQFVMLLFTILCNLLFVVVKFVNLRFCFMHMHTHCMIITLLSHNR